jgi:D-sedoheptulose 7-phosphate isomerase
MQFSLCNSPVDYFSQLQEAVLPENVGNIHQFAELLFDAWRLGRHVFVFGNGGSALTASHHILDYVKTARISGQPSLQATCLNDNIGFVLAIGNDIAFADIFKWQLEASAKPGDVAVAISASGNSLNVVTACQWARQNQLSTVCITGFNGGLIAEFADIHIHFPSTNYGVVEDLQMSVGHIVSQMLYQRVADHGKNS